MKLTVKTLKGSHFEIRVHAGDTIMAVKKNIEEIQGKESYPWGQQLLIHNGKVLKDESTLEENKVSEDGFLVVMLSKSKSSNSAGASSAQPPATGAVKRAAPSEPSLHVPNSANAAAGAPVSTVDVSSNVYGEAASTVVSGSNLEQTVQQLMEMGGGTWDRETVIRALRAAYNNPERAVDYLYSGIPVSADVAVPVAHSQGPEGGEGIAGGLLGFSGAPNSAPLNLFPSQDASNTRGGLLDFLRNNQQFQALRDIVHSNPQLLQPMLQELSKQNPQLLSLIQENHGEFLQLLNEPLDAASEGAFLEQPEHEEMPHSVTVTPEEEQAISRLEAMGFDRSRVVEAFLACDKNEQMAANYLLEHAADED